jgi:hypothetical protein
MQHPTATRAWSHRLVRGLILVLGVAWIATALAVPIGVVVWAGRDVAAGSRLLFGLNGGWLILLALTVAASLWKITAPMYAYLNGREYRLSAAVALVIWLPMAAWSCGVVVVLAPALLRPDAVAPPLGPLLALFWLAFDGLSGLVPLVLLPPEPRSARRRATSAASRSALERHVPWRALPAPNAKERVLALLKKLAAHPPGRVAAGIEVTTTGEIITSQGALGRHLDLPKQRINEGLHGLAHDNAITLATSAAGTRITVTAGSRRSAPT